MVDDAVVPDMLGRLRGRRRPEAARLQTHLPQELRRYVARDGPKQLSGVSGAGRAARRGRACFVCFGRLDEMRRDSVSFVSL